MFRTHTCFKALVAMSERMQPRSRADVRSERVPPCRACRAWWTQLCAQKDATVYFTWPGGTWSVPGDSVPSVAQHNAILSPPERREDGFTVIAVENQSCALWAHRTDDGAADPELYQSDLGDESYGPWQPLGLGRRRFVETMAIWNEANGGVLPSAVGGAGEVTSELIRDWRTVFESQWFTVFEQAGVRVCRAGDDLYLWGHDVDDVREAIHTLQLVWSDLEWK